MAIFDPRSFELIGSAFTSQIEPDFSLSCSGQALLWGSDFDICRSKAISLNPRQALGQSCPRFWYSLSPALL